MPARHRISIGTLQNRKRDGQKISMVTCYDYSTARIMEEAGIDSLLVGDTYAEVCLGHSSTLPMRLDHLVTIAEAVRRGAPNAYIVGDMPYLTYQVCPEEAIRNAGRFLAEAGCDCIKIEVDRRLVQTVKAMSAATIPVMAHLGLKPQSIHTVGSYKVQGKSADAALELVEDAQMMESAGAIALLLEAVPSEVAKIVTVRASIPVIGIVAGPHVDGQVVVFHDMIGYGGGHPPRSVKRYANLHGVMLQAFKDFVSDVTNGVFPAPENSVAMDPRQYEALNKLIERDAS
jgi:3-methyl-2-oxobutanoate hydroxymethyltransferase